MCEAIELLFGLVSGIGLDDVLDRGPDLLLARGIFRFFDASSYYEVFQYFSSV